MSANSDWQIKPKKLTPREKHIEESTRAVKHFLQTVAQDRLYLLAIVTGGLEHWRKIAGKAFRGFLVSPSVLDSMFQEMVQWAGPNPIEQYDQLQAADLVQLKLDKLKGLAAMITDERHLDEVLDRWEGHGFQAGERAALRTQLLIQMKTRGVAH